MPEAEARGPEVGRPWEGFYEKTSNRDRSRKLHSFRTHTYLAQDCVQEVKGKIQYTTPRLYARLGAHELWAKN